MSIQFKLEFGSSTSGYLCKSYPIKGACWGVLKYLPDAFNNLFRVVRENHNGDTLPDDWTDLNLKHNINVLSHISNVQESSGLDVLSAYWVWRTGSMRLKRATLEYAFGRELEPTTMRLRRDALKATHARFPMLFGSSITISTRDQSVSIKCNDHHGVVYNRLRLVRQFSCLAEEVAQEIIERPQLGIILASCYAYGTAKGGDNSVVKTEALDDELIEYLTDPKFDWRRPDGWVYDHQMDKMLGTDLHNVDYTDICHPYDGSAYSELWDEWGEDFTGLALDSSDFVDYYTEYFEVENLQ